jgi:hypothetical protein
MQGRNPVLVATTVRWSLRWQHGVCTPIARACLLLPESAYALPAMAVRTLSGLVTFVARRAAIIRIDAVFRLSARTAAA